MVAEESGVVLEAARFSDVVLAGVADKTPVTMRMLCGRIAVERGEVEVLEYRGSGYPIRLQRVGRTVLAFSL